MPDVAPPEHLRSEEDIRREQAGAMIGAVREFALRSMPIELRPVTPRDFVSPVPQPAIQPFWFKPKSSVPDNGLLPRAVLDRESVEWGTGGSVRVELGGGRII